MENEKPKEEEKSMIKISYTLPPSAQKSKLKEPTPRKEEIITNNEDNNKEIISEPKDKINHSMIEKENEAYINNSLVMTPPKSKRFSSKSKQSIVQNIKLNSSHKQSTDKDNKDYSPNTQKKEEEAKKLMEQLRPLSNQKKSKKKELPEEESKKNEDKNDDTMKVDNEMTQFGQYLEDNKIKILNNEPIQLEENSENLFTTIDFWKKYIAYIIFLTQKKEEKIPISKIFELSLKCLSYKTHTKDEVLSFPDFFYDTIVTNYSSEEISNFLTKKNIEGNLSKENISTLFPTVKEKKEDSILSSKKIKKKSVKTPPRQVTKEDIELYKYELIMRNKVDLVINNANSFAFGTSKRKDPLLNTSRVVVENMQSFSLLQNNEKEKEEIIDTSMHYNNKKTTKNKKVVKPAPPEKEEEDEPSDHSERSDSSETKDKKKKGKTKKKSNGMKTRNRSNKKRKK